MIRRPAIEAAVRARMAASPITAILGPRQCGKTTLAHVIAATRGTTFFDLEDPLDYGRLEDPRRALDGLRGLVVLDEIQKRPALFEYLRVLADRRPHKAKFLILGSAAPSMVKHVSETLAGRIAFVEMGGLTLSEVGRARQERLWQRGGFPRSFLAATDAMSLAWREDFISTFLERDLPQLEVRVPAATLRRFWTMVAHYHGQTWNGAEIAASMGMAHTVSRRYLDLFTGTFMIRQLQPWFENIGKRVVKSPKIYLRDPGVLHALLGLKARRDLEAHPKFGASWEGFALEHVLAVTGDRHAYFWATHAGAELDLMVVARGKKWGFEFKASEMPSVTKSMAIASTDLDLARLWIVHPGTASHPLRDRVDLLALRDVPRVLAGAGL